MKDQSELSVMVSEIIAAYVSNNLVPISDLPPLITSVHRALAQIEEPQAEPPEPAILKSVVSIKKSVTPDYLICLEDGKKFKSLRRHLRTCYNMTPEDYRKKWNLDKNYPMVAPNYSEARSKLAKKMRLGQKR